MAVSVNLVVPVTAALIRSAFRRPNKDKRIVIQGDQVNVVDAEDEAGASQDG
jgi:hypothetical protein